MLWPLPNLLQWILVCSSCALRETSQPSLQEFVAGIYMGNWYPFIFGIFWCSAYLTLTPVVSNNPFLNYLTTVHYLESSEIHLQGDHSFVSLRQQQLLNSLDYLSNIPPVLLAQQLQSGCLPILQFYPWKLSWSTYREHAVKNAPSLEYRWLTCTVPIRSFWMFSLIRFHQED